jgi:hypothetical protein
MTREETLAMLTEVAGGNADRARAVMADAEVEIARGTKPPRDVRRVHLFSHPYKPGSVVEVEGVTFEVVDCGVDWLDMAVKAKEPPRETHPDLVHARNLWEAQHDMRGLRSLAISEKYGRSHLWEKTDVS